MDIEEKLKACEFGTAHEAILLTSEAEIREAAIYLSKQAHREIIIMSRELDPMIFGHHDFADRLRTFISQRNSKMRVLVNMDRKIIQTSHRLTGLALKHSSTITIHRIDQRKRNFQETSMLCDGVAMLLRPSQDHARAILDCDAAGKIQPILEDFERLWRNSEPIPELHTLGM